MRAFGCVCKAPVKALAKCRTTVATHCKHWQTGHNTPVQVVIGWEGISGKNNRPTQLGCYSTVRQSDHQNTQNMYEIHPKLSFHLNHQFSSISGRSDASSFFACIFLFLLSLLFSYWPRITCHSRGAGAAAANRQTGSAGRRNWFSLTERGGARGRGTGGEVELGLFPVAPRAKDRLPFFLYFLANINARKGTLLLLTSSPQQKLFHQ